MSADAVDATEVYGEPPDAGEALERFLRTGDGPSGPDHDVAARVDDPEPVGDPEPDDAGSWAHDEEELVAPPIQFFAAPVVEAPAPKLWKPLDLPSSTTNPLGRAVPASAPGTGFVPLDVGSPGGGSTRSVAVGASPEETGSKKRALLVVLAFFVGAVLLIGRVVSGAAPRTATDYSDPAGSVIPTSAVPVSDPGVPVAPLCTPAAPPVAPVAFHPAGGARFSPAKKPTTTVAPTTTAPRPTTTAPKPTIAPTTAPPTTRAPAPTTAAPPPTAAPGPTQAPAPGPTAAPGGGGGAVPGNVAPSTAVDGGPVPPGEVPPAVAPPPPCPV